MRARTVRITETCLLSDYPDHPDQSGRLLASMTVSAAPLVVHRADAASARRRRLPDCASKRAGESHRLLEQGTTRASLAAVGTLTEGTERYGWWLDQPARSAAPGRPSRCSSWPQGSWLWDSDGRAFTRLLGAWR
ncbi:hypothetical protein ACPA9J_35030 [Pseudomonas aeruginosa]